MPTDLLNEIWASAPVDVERYPTLQLSNPNFEDDDGNPADHFLVGETLVPLTATLETGTQATFLPIAFGYRYPEKGVKGREDLKITIDGVSQLIARQLDLAAEGQHAPIYCTYREFVSSDLSAPQIQHHMILVNPQVSEMRVTATAVYSDAVNKQFPSTIRKVENYPGLAGV